MELILQILIAFFVIRTARKYLETATRLPEWDNILAKVWIASLVLWAIEEALVLTFISEWYAEAICLLLLYVLYLLKEDRLARLSLIALSPFTAISILSGIFSLILPRSVFDEYATFFSTIESFSVFWMIGFGFFAFRQTRAERLQRQVEEEKNRILEEKKQELEYQVAERTAELTRQKEELQEALAELKATQNQLIQSEKLASLGELTAGIAHEIQNPLNFVNNFSELSVELIDELKAERQKAEGTRDAALENELLDDLIQNQEKINYHGKRASSIVKGMLEHSRTSTGKKEYVDINALADEYLRISYHGLRAKDKSFNADFNTDFDPNLSKIEVIPQDLGRVILNLINNAFYAVNERRVEGDEEYAPKVVVATQQTADNIIITVKDNGTGIPESVKAKIFQPFFTTKPTGQGTGLGLSLAYDIITKGHGGTIEVESVEGEGTEFIVRLPFI